MQKCPKCNEWNWPHRGGCGCKPFTVTHEGDTQEVYAIDSHSAALKYAQDWNEDGDYALMNSTESIEINGKGYTISAEPDIHYLVTENDK